MRRGLAAFIQKKVAVFGNLFFVFSLKGSALRPMDDPCTVVKLSEAFSDCYAEQHDNYLEVSNSTVLI
jgi:hypothetical protein